MNHRNSINHLSRKSANRKALVRNEIESLFEHGRIKTTEAKAKVVRRYAERLITRAKIDSVHNRRQAIRHLYRQKTLASLFTNIAPFYKEREGGYTRILKLGFRINDAAHMVLLELVDYDQFLTQKVKEEEAS